MSRNDQQPTTVFAIRRCAQNLARRNVPELIQLANAVEKQTEFSIGVRRGVADAVANLLKHNNFRQISNLLGQTAAQPVIADSIYREISHMAKGWIAHASAEPSRKDNDRIFKMQFSNADLEFGKLPLELRTAIGKSIHEGLCAGLASVPHWKRPRVEQRLADTLWGPHIHRYSSWYSVIQGQPLPPPLQRVSTIETLSDAARNWATFIRHCYRAKGLFGLSGRTRNPPIRNNFN